MAKGLNSVALALLISAVLAGAGPAFAASKANAKLLTFEATTVSGLAYKSKALLGAKPSVIWFWAPWCAICRGEGPALASLSKKYQGKINFVGVGALGTQPQFQEFVAATKTDQITHLDDSSGQLWSRFGIVLQPSFVFISKTGKLTKKVGPTSASYLSKAIAELAK